MLFTNKNNPIKVGDFVIGIRKNNSQRIFEEPSMVLKIENQKVMIVIGDDIKWYLLAEVEKVYVAQN